jgi:DNA-binding response OmpR family regulator
MKNILIIEDDPKIAIALEIRFKAGGYGTLTAGDAVSGMSKAVQNQPDLIVLDISLPGGNGLDLAQQFKHLPETRRAPIIFITASRAPNLREQVMDLGAAGLFEKPYDSDELLAVAGHALGETGMFKRPIARYREGADRLVPRLPQPLLKKVLIVEDDPKLALSLAVRLRAAGFEASMAYDALSGVNMAVQQRPDLMLLDVSMPAGNGYVVAERVRELLSRRTPIIFLTGSTMPDAKDRAKQLGAAGYFEKPFDAEELLAAVQAQIGA